MSDVFVSYSGEDREFVQARLSRPKAFQSGGINKSQPVTFSGMFWKRN